jgi:DNA-directed RNA polymerase specialized sigma24 family protein
VAYRTAQKARVYRTRALTARRRLYDRVTAMAQRARTEDEIWHDLQPVLDQELQRLPDKYRAAVVLCDLEGKPRKEAARQLGWPEGTLSGRLARARRLLARAHCRLGSVVRPARRGRRLVVRAQRPRAGTRRPAGSRVIVVLRPVRRHR